MDQTVALVPLVCIKCSTPIPADPGEVAWVCKTCGQGNYLYETKELHALDVFYSHTLAPNAVGKPYWVAEGQVSVQRETYGSSKNSESDRYWSQPHRFFIPAHRSPLENLLTQAVALLANPPQLQPGPPASFQPVVLEQSEFLPALEFLVVAVEAGRPDRLKKIDLQVKHDLPVLWILP